MCKEICMDVAAGMPENQAAETCTLTVEEARARIAATIGAAPEEIYFTSGGGEADAFAVKAAASVSGQKHPHIIVTTMEAPEALEMCGQLEREGAEVTYLNPITTGRVEVAMIENEIQPDTCLISVTAANSETGTSEPFTGIGTMTSARGILFHTDASYGYGRMPINVDRSHIDMLSADASFFGGPAGTGFLYVRKSTGAGEYVREHIVDEAKIGRMALTAENVTADVPAYMETTWAVRNHLCERVFAEIEDVELNGHKDHHLVNHLNIRIKNVSAAVVQKELANEGIQVGISTGSKIMNVIGRTPAEAAESVRFSLSADTTMEDVDKTVELLKKSVTGQRVI